MNAPGPILVAPLFAEIRQHLLALLDGLSAEEWLLPTSAGKWNVKDVAAHLLGGDTGNLSRRRDAHDSRGKPFSGWHELVAYINHINASWVDAAQRISPRLLCDLLAHVGRQADDYFLSLDPFALGGAVSWAGPEPAPQWLDVAREYTERWHHQQQIRDATGKPGLYESRLFAPVLDTFVRALPQTFRDVAAPAGTVVQLTVSGEGGGEWALHRADKVWELLVGQSEGSAAQVTIAAENTWKIFTRGLRGDAARRCAEIRGDSQLGLKVLDTVSVIA
jgi:uncharacterized protein (TIGR03083 family)